jgi:hypothetical protein
MFGNTALKTRFPYIPKRRKLLDQLSDSRLPQAVRYNDVSLTGSPSIRAAEEKFVV